MRRFFAFAAILIGFVACQNDAERMDVTVGDLEVKVAVTVPESRAGSHEGIFQSGLLNSDSLTMRYILQIYYTDPETKTSIDPIRLVEYSDDKGVVFEVRLAPGRDYKFVAWADVVAGEADVDNHYDTSDLRAVTLKGEWNAMDETRDAYTAADSVLNFNSASTISLSLRRPNAKLRVVTTDWADDAVDTVTVTYTTPHRTTFNALTGQFGDPTTTKVHTYTLSNVYNEPDNNRTIFSDYFFAGDNDNVKFDMVVKNGSKVTNHQFNTGISVNSNYLTTIKGKLLTGGSSSSESQEL
ncbi:MAG: hypothetical protein IKW31_02385 [Alistipes sp.]|nr:hypothetical protein [Alistipes sp.]